MFGGGNNDNDVDVTKDLCVDQLLRETQDSNMAIWLKKDYPKYDTYYLEHDIHDGMKICFKLFFPLTHDSFALNAYLMKKKSRVNMFIIRGEKVRQLIHYVVNNKKYYCEGI